MKNKIIEIIKNNRLDKSNYIGYIKCFCENEKAEELFKKNNEFHDLKEKVKEKKD